MGVWNLFRQSQAFGKNPSEVFGIRGNPWLAWQFDNAVALFGRWVENRIAAHDEQGKPLFKTLAAALGDPAKRVTVFKTAGLREVR